MDCGIFNMCMDVNTRNCTLSFADTVRKSALIVDSRRKIPRHTRKPNLRQQRAGPMLYQLSDIPIHSFCDDRCTRGSSDLLNFPFRVQICLYETFLVGDLFALVTEMMFCWTCLLYYLFIVHRAGSMRRPSWLNQQMSWVMTLLVSWPCSAVSAPWSVTLLPSRPRSEHDFFQQ